LFDALRTEEKRLVDLVSDPSIWGSHTDIVGWTVQDVVCHLIDETEDYLRRWDMAGHRELRHAMDLATFRENVRRRALSYLHLTHDEAIARFASAASVMMATFRGLTKEQWGGLNVAHPLFGVLPAARWPASGWSLSQTAASASTRLTTWPSRQSYSATTTPRRCF
jgi:Mycothiol maleylpyruvate isomerase N-terminal domain